jgi:tight adherence protein B
MESHLLLLVYGAAFAGTLLVVDGVYRLLADARAGPQGKINRRLRMLASGTDPQEVLRLLRRPTRHGAGGRLPLWARLDALVIQAGLTVSTGRVVAAMGGLCLVAYFGLNVVLGLAMPAAVVGASLFGIGGPLAVLSVRRRQRLVRFNQQLPDAIDLIVRSLRAGHPLNAAMAVVADEMPDPIGSEVGIAVDEATYGLDLRDAIQNLADRVGLADLHYMVVSIRIQYGAGGNLAEVLSGLSKVIRDRFNMARKIKAVSAEGRFSGYVLTALPLLTAGAIWMLNPAYYTGIADDPRTPYLIYGTITLIVLNVLIINRLVNFRV